MRSRGDKFELLLGTLVSGLSALGFITLASHSLGLDRFMPILQIWTIWALSAGVLSFSIQQHLIRSAGFYRNVAHALRSPETCRITVFMMLGIAVVTMVWRVEIFGENSLVWPLIAVVIPLGCGATSAARGLWSERRNFRLVALLLALENVLRVVAAAIIYPLDPSPVAFAGCIVLGFGVSFYAPRSEASSPIGSQPIGRPHSTAVAGFLAYATLVMAPTVMATKSAGTVETSSTFLLLAILRAPYQFALGLVPKLAANRQSMNMATKSAESGDPTRGFGKRRLLVPTFLLASGIIGSALVLPKVLPVFFGNPVEVSFTQSLLATVATAIAVVNVLLTVASTSVGLDRQLMAIWMAIAGLGLVSVAVAPSVSLTSMLCTVAFVELGVAVGLTTLLVRNGVPFFVGEDRY